MADLPHLCVVSYKSVFYLNIHFFEKKNRCFNILMPLMRTRSPFYLTILASMLSTILFSILSDSQSQLRLLSENHNQDGRGIYLFIFVPPLSVCGKKKKYSHKKEQITSKGFADVYGPA